MKQATMTLKILLPFRVFLEAREVQRIVAETSAGSCGFLPQRLDGVTALVPGILSYRHDGGTEFVAVDEGVLVKAGPDVLVSVRNAIGGADLGRLQVSVEKEFMHLDEKEKNARSMMAKLESSFIQTLERFRKS
jgi:F-type H+-transporting ATPase subunit epsilon